MTLYSKNLNVDLASRIWDIFFIEGFITLLKTAIGKNYINNIYLVILDFLNINIAKL